MHQFINPSRSLLYLMSPIRTIPEVNKTLEEILHKLKDPSTSLLNARALAQNANLLLHRAIDKAPTEVTAVEIQYTVKTDLPNVSDIRIHASQRRTLVDFLNKSHGSIHLTFPLADVLTLPLPYRFPFNPAKNAYEVSDYTLTTLGFRQDIYAKDTVPYLTIDLSSIPGPLRHETYLDCSEIDSIRLVHADTYSPGFKDFSANPALTSRPSFPVHYLDYRQFVPGFCSKRRMPDFEDKDTIMTLAHTLLLPREETELLSTTGPKGRRIHGFIARVTDDRKDVSALYECNDVPAPSDLTDTVFDDSVVAASILRRHNTAPDPRIRCHTGTEIVSRLHQIPRRTQSYHLQ